MKILVLSGLYPLKNNPISGIFITRRIKKLIEHNVQVKLIAFQINETFSFKVYRKFCRCPLNKDNIIKETDGIIYNYLPVKNSLLDRVFLSKKAIHEMTNLLIDELKSESYDLIHVHWVYPDGYIASLVREKINIPLIISALGSDIRVFPYTYPKRLLPTKYALNTADKMFFESKNLLSESYKLGYEGQNFEIIPTIGVNTKVFTLSDKLEARKILELKPNGKYVGFIGRLVPVKNADLLPEIFENAHIKDSSVEFIVIGNGELKANLMRRCEKLNFNVHFIDYIADNLLPVWMNALDLLILPSKSEGLPHIILEAQSCGCPVVGSDAGGIPEAIGYGGEVVNLGSGFIENFSDSIIQIVSNPPDRELVRASVIKFDSDQVIERQIKAYRELIQGNRLNNSNRNAQKSGNKP